MKIFQSIAVLLTCLTVDFTFAEPTPTNKEIVNQLIERSINNYRGNCPCPYNRDSAGRKCGKRSAWSKPGGASPICFASDVTKDMIERYKANIKTRQKSIN